MNKDEAKYLEHAREFEQVIKHKGFMFFLDIIRDEFIAEEKLRHVVPPEHRTLGEEYSYQEGRVDAAHFIVDRLPEKILRIAEEISRHLTAETLVEDEETPTVV